MGNLFKTLIPLISLFAVTGCIKEMEKSYSGGNTDSTLTNLSRPLIIELVQMVLQIEDMNMKAPIEDTTLLWNNRGHTPIMAPDGHQVTLAEFISVAGKGKVVYTSRGADITIELRGLIPNGLYSMWILVFKRPGFHGNFDNLIGNGALALTTSWGNNTFTAFPSGTASLSATIHAQTLSVFGSVGNCLCSEYEIHLMGDYHSNNLIRNGTAGDPGFWITQFFFPFLGGH